MIIPATLQEQEERRPYFCGDKPFIDLRASPLQRYPLDNEFGLAGWLCEQYRLETLQGEWRTFPVMYDDDTGHHIREDGYWAFWTNGEICLGIPSDSVLAYFNLTRETFMLLRETACASNTLFAMYHYTPRGEWSKAVAWRADDLYPEYERFCIDLHIDRKAKTIAHAEFGSIARKQSSNPLDNLARSEIELCHTYISAFELFEQIDVFDPEYDERKAALNILSLRLTALQRDLRDNTPQPIDFARRVAYWIPLE